MPINQTPTPREGENRFALAYPLRPGETRVRLEYALDYQPPLDLSKPLDQPAGQTHIVTPGEGVQVTGENLVSVGNEPSTGFAAYRVTPVGNVVRVQISGQAPAGSTGTAEAAPESGSLVPIPDPVSQRRWLVLSVLGLVLLAGFVYHYTH